MLSPNHSKRRLWFSKRTKRLGCFVATSTSPGMTFSLTSTKLSAIVLSLLAKLRFREVYVKHRNKVSQFIKIIKVVMNFHDILNKKGALAGAPFLCFRFSCSCVGQAENHSNRIGVSTSRLTSCDCPSRVRCCP